MKIVILSVDYPNFLAAHYAATPDLAVERYAVQLQSRYDTLFGGADFYSRNFQALGHTATEIFANNGWMQNAWAREHGLALRARPTNDKAVAGNALLSRLKRQLRPYKSVLTPFAKRLGLVSALSPAERKVLQHQIEEINPDVVLNQAPDVIEANVMAGFRRPGRVLIVQYGNEPTNDMDFSPYDFGISLVPWIVEFFRGRGLPAELMPLAFETSVLDRIGPAPDKDIELSFVGGVSSGHAARLALLEAVAREFPIKLWVSNIEGIPRSSPLHKRYCGTAWGRNMYDILRRSHMTLNSHIDAARGLAVNMRMFEATGVGTFLLTDNMQQPSPLFEAGIHVGAYQSVEDCLAKIRLHLDDGPARERIARAGQQHTLQHHTYRHRMEQILALIGKYG